jgi:hypothetical protein
MATPAVVPDKVAEPWVFLKVSRGSNCCLDGLDGLGLCKGRACVKAKEEAKALEHRLQVLATAALPGLFLVLF